MKAVLTVRAEDTRVLGEIKNIEGIDLEETLENVESKLKILLTHLIQSDRSDWKRIQIEIIEEG